VIDNNGIIFVAKLGVFNVLGCNETRVVKIYPKENCSCGCKTSCYHIMAVKLSLGIDISTDRKLLNLTSLRKRCRTNVDKTCGRKRPRKMDLDTNNCYECKRSDPVMKSTKTTWKWIGCNHCDKWFHDVCLKENIDVKADFKCNYCID